MEIKEWQVQAKIQFKNTWNQLRIERGRVDWDIWIRFKHSTPNFAFTPWLAIHHRLTTRDRMLQWNRGISPACVLCGHPLEIRNHLFFSFHYSVQVCSFVTHGLLSQSYTSYWTSITHLITNPPGKHIENFLIGYAFQTSLYHIWREINERRHGNTPSSPAQLIKIIDKTVRNRVSSIRAADKQYDDDLVVWFVTRA